MDKRQVYLSKNHKIDNKKYVINNSTLMEEWDYIINNNLGYDPKTILHSSSNKVWWKCKEGHSWEDSPYRRSKGSGCPICAKEKRRISHSKNWIIKKGSLFDNNPTLAKEWHPTKNGALKFTEITVSNAKKVWWLCGKGHEWQAVISSRNHGAGCPICSGHKILVGYNDLATVNHELAKEWHPSKNGNLQAKDVTINCGKRVWWLCSKGHEWQTAICNRSRGSNCPICSGHKILVGYNDLATLNPQLASEWHPTKNNILSSKDVTIYSNKKVWWKCEKGHEWQASVSNRSYGRRCPKCFGETKTSFPEQAMFFYFSKLTTAYNRYMLNSKTEIDVYLPEYKIGIEYDGWYFHKGENAKKKEIKKREVLSKNGINLFRLKEVKDISTINADNNVIYLKSGPNDEELKIAITNLIFTINSSCGLSFNIDIDIRRDRSAIYECYIQNEKERSLINLNSKLASEWHPTKNGLLKPDSVTVSSNKKVWWLCSKGHEWQAVINSRNQGAGCPICSGHKILVGYNDLATLNPQLANEWHPTKNDGLLPNMVTLNSNRRIWWVCEKGHEWQTLITDRVRGTNCPICSNKKVLIGYNDLKTKNPKLASEWHTDKNGKLTPQDVTSGSSKYVWWKCKMGHEWKAAISSRNMGYNCPYCAGQKGIIGVNDLETKNPSLASEWHPTKNGDLKPSNFMPGSNKKVWWLGKCGHEWSASIASRNSGRGCPYCSSQKLLIGFNDLETKNPSLASEWHPTKNGDLKPSNFMPGSNKKVWWLGKCGHEWENVINTRNGGNGCPYCSSEKLLIGFNDLKTKKPELAAEWHPTKNGVLKSSDFMPNSNKKAWWIGKCGHEWESVISSRSQGVGCPYCAGKKVLVGFNDLATVNPKLAKEWHPTKNIDVKPTEVSRGSNKKVWWIGMCGHEWVASVNQRSSGRNCPYCAGQKKL
ncbi:MAG: zinc-ribbon domain-containing protein [Clostridia bacterium]|nr:zinc-ribbon domain-containing protein [Clostridia bacterium]